MDKRRHCHVVGVGGIGMSALAEVLVARGDYVTGSDRSWDRGEDSIILDRLVTRGVVLVPQDGGAITSRTTSVVVSSAIEPGNPELVMAARLNVPVRHRSDLLAECLANKRVIAVSGTSGKSTVTAMIGWVLQELGEDPVVVNGAIVPAWSSSSSVGNVRHGNTDLCVIEADESDRTLNAYNYDWAVVTNASTDHFDVEEARRLFQTFASRANVGSVSAVEEPALLDFCHPETGDRCVAFQYADITFRVPMPGIHNAMNAMLAVILMERMGYALQDVADGLASFPGLHRRLELVGECGGIRVFDDYAHNPAKISAAWTGVRQGEGRVLAIWRPHGYGPLRQMMGSLVDAFARIMHHGDQLILLPVFDAGGTADRSVSSRDLAVRLHEAGVSAVQVLKADRAAAELVGVAEAGDTVLVMGARDPGLPALAQHIAKRIGL